MQIAARPEVVIAQQGYKYWAFISYSHQDKTWGDWLHRTLESFRVPARLVGRPSRDGGVPKRLFPVFRDREELPSSADLGNNISDALGNSRYLIVICSPQSAVSRWVNEEIKAFKRLGREDRILALIVSGEPNASDRPDSGELECFPSALRHKVDAQGTVLKERVEPIAADARPGKDGRTNARLKLLAGLLGVGYDELKQREKQRRIRRRLQWAAAAIILVTLLLEGWHWKAKQDLTSANIERGRQALLVGNAFTAAAYLNAAYQQGDASPATRLMLAQALAPLRGNVRLWHAGPKLFTAHFTAEGTELLTAEDSALKRWDSATGALRSTLALQGAPLRLVAFSPSGRHAAVGVGGVTVELYDLDRNARQCLLQASAPVQSASYDAGEDRLITVDSGVNVDVFDLASCQRLATLHTATPYGPIARLSPDGTRALTSDSGHVRVWDAHTGRQAFTLAGTFDSAVFDADGTTVRTLRSGRVEFWNTRDGHIKNEIQGPEYLLNVLTGIPEMWPLDGGRRYLVSNYDGPISLFDSAAPGLTPLPLLADKGLLDVRESPDGQLRVLVKEGAGVIAVRDPDMELPQAELALPPIEFYSFGFDPSGARVLAFAKDGSLLVWQVASAPIGFKAGDNWEAMTDGQWSPDGTRFLFAASDGALALFDMRSQRVAWESHACATLDGPPLFDHSGTRIAAGCSASQWSLLDARDGALLHPLAGIEEKPRTLAFSLDDRRLLYQGDGLWVWDLQNWKQFAPPMVARTLDWLAELTPDGRGLVTWGKTLRFFDLDSGEQQLDLPLAHYNAEYTSLSGDGRMLTLLYTDGRVERWDLATRRQAGALQINTGNIHEAAVSRDTRRLLIIDDRDARVVDTRTGRVLASLEQRTGSATLHERSRIADVDEWDPVTAFNPTGEFVLAAAGNMLGVWDANDGRLLSILGRFTQAISSASYSPDGAHVGASDGFTLRVYETPMETRTKQDIQRLMDCRVPLQPAGDKLVSVALRTEGCQSAPD